MIIRKKSGKPSAEVSEQHHHHTNKKQKDGYAVDAMHNAKVHIVAALPEKGKWVEVMKNSLEQHHPKV